MGIFEVNTFEPSIGYGWEQETIEEKARWFQSLPFEQRMKLFCDMTNLALELNPGLADKKDARPLQGRVRVLTLP